MTIYGLYLEQELNCMAKQVFNPDRWRVASRVLSRTLAAVAERQEPVWGQVHGSVRSECDSWEGVGEGMQVV